MGFFGLKKKSTNTTPSASAGRPLSQSSSRQLTASLIIAEPTPPTLRLRVAVHPVSPGLGRDELLWVVADPEGSVEELRSEISQRLGGIAVGLFKVAIPCDAFEQAAQYSRRYDDRPDLISHFPAYSLDDPLQLLQSLGSAGWQMHLPPTIRIKDWWPTPPANEDIISIIARPARHGASTSSLPLTLLAHFALPTTSPSSASPLLSHSRTSSPSTKIQRRLPTPIDILPTDSVAQLKAALLTADSRRVERLDKVVLWRVEMSEEEMVVIEERGGLKSGQMPWPYPPTAEVPTALSNDSLPVSHYFPDAHSNTRLVSLSVWIHPSAAESLARIPAAAALDAPPFRYPMTFPTPEVRRASTCASLPSDSPPLNLEAEVASSTLPRAAGRSRRSRPSTAPAASSSPLAFGAGLRAKSPLGRVPVHDPTVKGLGIAGSDLPPISLASQQVSELGEGMTKMQLKVDIGDSGVGADGRIIWQPAVGSLGRSQTQSRGIRSLANNKSLTAYEIA